MENQRKNQRGGVTGKGFVQGDPRINRKPGPGRPPIWWKQALARYEPEALRAIIHLLRKAEEEGVRLRAAQDIMDRLHGKPTQPVEVVPPVDLSGLTDKELNDFNRLLARVLPGNGSGGARRSGQAR